MINCLLFYIIKYCSDQLGEFEDGRDELLQRILVASLEWVRYCGSSQLKGEGVFPAETVGYVTVSYPSDKLCNIKAMKSLTADCLPFPTETGCFTRPSAELSPRVIQSLVSASLVGEEEGGK